MRKQVNSMKRYKRERSLLIFFFLFIPMILLAMFIIYPVVTMFIYSFTDWNGYGFSASFVALKNYIRIFTDAKYWIVFENSAYYLVAGLLQQAISLMLAALFMKPRRLAGFFKGSIFFPYLINTVAVTFIFLMFYEKNGTLDSVLAFFHLEEYSKLWIANPATVKFALAFTSMWKNLGYSFIIYLGAMQSVSSEIYEAVEIDGAGSMGKLRYITLPNIKMIIGLMLLMTIIGSLTVFDIPYIMTKGQNGTNTFLSTIVDVAFTYNQFGLACALSIVLLLLITVIVAIQKLVLKEESV